MVLAETPARSFSRVRSMIWSGGVVSMNWTRGSMDSGYWTRACIVGSSAVRLRSAGGLGGLALPGLAQLLPGERQSRGLFGFSRNRLPVGRGVNVYGRCKAE